MNPILSTKEASEFLGTTSEVVRRWCREGYLPSVKIGREYRISTAALIDWWEEQGGGRLDFEAFYSVQKGKQKTEDIDEKDEQKAVTVAKKAKKKTEDIDEKDEQKADEVAEKTDIPQRKITRNIVR